MEKSVDVVNGLVEGKNEHNDSCDKVQTDVELNKSAKDESGSTETIIKSDKSDKAVEVEYQVEGTESDIAELGKMLNINGLTVADAVKALSKSLEQQKLEQQELAKGMYDVQRVADILQSIYYLTLSAKAESAYEGDNSPLPGKLKAVAVSVAEILKEMVTEETMELLEELTEDESGEAMEMSQVACGLIKAGARNSKSDAALVQSMHDLAKKLGAGCAAAESASKVDSAEDLIKMDKESLSKSISDAVAIAVEPLSKALTKAEERVKMLEAQPMPAKGVLRVVSKSDDVAEPFVQEPLVVKKADGTINEVASMIKNIQRNGGQPF